MPESKEVVRPELPRPHDVETADDISHQAMHLLEIANEIAGQLRVLPCQLCRPHCLITLVKLPRTEEFTRRRRGQGKAFRRLDLMQLFRIR